MSGRGRRGTSARSPPGRRRAHRDRRPSDPWARLTADSIVETTGRHPDLLPNAGGSLPNDVFTNVLGMPTVWIPHSYPGCNQHAPDEHVLAPLMREGLAIMTGIFWDVGERSSDGSSPTRA